MGRINIANFKKAIYYLKRNGLKNTLYAAKERLEEKKAAPYVFEPVSEIELECQRKRLWDKEFLFSIVVPTYRTKDVYLKEMLESVRKQSYSNWELILADATEDGSVKEILDRETCEIASEIAERIHYIKLPENAGIAVNTNEALAYAKGEYIGLLDHDDLLTEDALYEMASFIEAGKNKDGEPQMLYSDEDKCDGSGAFFYEPNRKEAFNYDLLLSNNYICHFMVMKRELMQTLMFRSEYDGAQDYDLVLRAAMALRGQPNSILHVPKVLYHWRCHNGSTAENPQSKQYAYDAGLHALQSLADACGYRARAIPLKHLGFYRLEYSSPIFQVRSDLGAVGGRVLKRENCFGVWRILSGRMSGDGKIYYEDLPAAYSGYLHRAVLTQDAEALDIRCIQVRPECHQLFQQVIGVPYLEKKVQENIFFDAGTLPEDSDYIELSLWLAQALREAGYDMLYDPSKEVFWRGGVGT